MKTFRKSIVLLFLAAFTANADLGQFEQEKRNIADPSAIDNTRISVYLHPVMLLIGANAETTFFYSTIEIPTSLYNAPIIKPSIWLNSEFSRIGSDFGWRHYPAGRGEGLYLQPSVGFFYFSAYDSFSLDFTSDTVKYEEKKRNGTWFDVMGYLGYTYKFAYLSIYSDTGIGYACIFSECGLMFDANMGIGISF
ncbi:MAG: hypothetical protein LBH25_07780 [Fibromonadaceae bacterium]|jgi:hypothetical protein|nr:hypothetical protein [Fibromonadaceae bacterium]